MPHFYHIIKLVTPHPRKTLLLLLLSLFISRQGRCVTICRHFIFMISLTCLHQFSCWLVPSMELGWSSFAFSRLLHLRNLQVCICKPIMFPSLAGNHALVTCPSPQAPLPFPCVHCTSESATAVGQALLQAEGTQHTEQTSAFLWRDEH